MEQRSLLPYPIRKSAFFAFLGADIPCHFRCPNHPPLGILHRRDGHRHIDQRTVFSRANSFEVIDPLPQLESPNDFRFFIPARARDDQRDWLANGFCLRISKYPFRTLVPARDRAVKFLADDRIVGRIDDGGEQSGGWRKGAAASTSFRARDRRYIRFRDRPRGLACTCACVRLVALGSRLGFTRTHCGGPDYLSVIDITAVFPAFLPMPNLACCPDAAGLMPESIGCEK